MVGSASDLKNTHKVDINEKRRGKQKFATFYVIDIVEKFAFFLGNANLFPEIDLERKSSGSEAGTNDVKKDQ